MDETIILTNTSYCKNYLKNLESLWKQQVLCDVALEAEGNTIFGHRIILAASCPYLNSLLTQQQMTSVAQVNIQFDNTTYSVLYCLIDFMYTGKLKATKRNIHELIQTAEEFGLIDVVSLCEGFIATGHISYPLEKSWCEKAKMFSEIFDVVETSITKAVQNRKKARKNQRKLQADDNLSLEYTEERTWHVSRSGRKCSLPKRYVETAESAISDSDHDEADSDGSTTSVEHSSLHTDEILDMIKATTVSKTGMNEQAEGNKNKNNLENVAAEVNNASSQSITEKKHYHRQCNRCHRKFKSHTVLLQHRTSCYVSQKEGHPEKYTHTKCRKCKYAFKTHKDLVKHRKLCNVQVKNDLTKPYKCDICTYEHFSQKGVDLHKHAKHGTDFDSNRYQILTCEQCQYKTIDHARMKAHTSTHNENLPFVCEHCSKRFRVKSNLEVHMRLHDDVRPFACKECGKSFRQQGTLKGHIDRIHKKLQPFLCGHCPYTSYVKSSLAFHEFRVHNIPLPESITWYKCEMCEFVCKSSASFEAHKRRHTGEKPFQCNICSKAFVGKGALREHMQWHSGQRKHKCPFDGCSHACISKTKLNEHMRLIHTHKGEKPWQCHMCSYRCAVKGNLTKHLRSIHHLKVLTNQRRVHTNGKQEAAGLVDTNVLNAGANGEQEKNIIMTDWNSTTADDTVVVTIVPGDITQLAGAGDFVSSEANVAADIVAVSNSVFTQSDAVNK